MKIRLKLVSPGGAATTFEHAGPLIRIGRDPACELTLEGASSDGVSRQHARIELTADGANLTDVGSSNGTRLNGKLVEAAMPLREGDYFQLGFTGPTLTVVELDLATGTQASGSISWRSGALVGIPAVSLVVIIALYLLRPAKPVEPPAPGPSVRTISPEEIQKILSSSLGAVSRVSGLVSGCFQLARVVLISPGMEGRQSPEIPNPRIEEIGQYLAPPPQLPISVVLQRLNEQQLWTMLRPGDKVSSGHTLLSLPGYRSTLLLNSGVGLLLDGNLPEFSSEPFVLESVVTLHKPTDGFHADLTLEHGRVRLAGATVEGPVKIRLRFLQEVWDVTLYSKQSEAAVMLWYRPGQGTCFGLLNEGKVRVEKLQKSTHELPSRSFLYWQSNLKSEPAPESEPDLPNWWTGPKDLKELAVRDALRGLEDWQNWFKQAGDVAGFIADQVLGLQFGNIDSTHRALGMHFLAAMERTSILFNIQERGEIPERVRKAAMLALWLWVMQGADRLDAFEKLALQQYTDRTTVDAILKLLELKPEELEAPATLKQLVSWLGHDRLIVRQFAHWHLERLRPENAEEIQYDPTRAVAERAKKIKKWQEVAQ